MMTMWQRHVWARPPIFGLISAAALLLAFGGGVRAAPVMTLPVAAQARVPSASVAVRLRRLEHIVNGRGLMDMQVRLDALQRNVQQLRGQIELQNHRLTELKRRQRDLYVDLDRRMSQLERAGDGTTMAPSGVRASNPAAQGAPKAFVPARAPHRRSASRAVTATKAHTAKEQHAYQVAFDLLRELRYDQAITAFHTFLKDYPQGRYAHIAQYWVAEANYAQRRFKNAIADYQDLLDDYPHSPKRAEAMLKIGYCYYELGDIKRAQESLKNLTATYPNTTEAGQAKNLLQKLRVQASQPAR